MPLIRSTCQLLVWVCLAQNLSAQELLTLDLSNRCIYYAQGIEEELYSFRNESTEVADMVAEILQCTGDNEQNFKLIQANVENVSAVVAGDKRFLLWSLLYWEAASPLERYASLSHEIGHHLNLHRLSPPFQDMEELEADEFMGFVLGMKNFSFQSVSKALVLAGAQGEVLEKRKLAAMKGYARADKSLRVSALAFANDPSWADFQKAAFPFPPPDCYQFAELGKGTCFVGCNTLGDVGAKIARAFESKGYPYRFMSLPDGFAVISQLEQYQEDGSILPNTTLRWHDLPQAESFSLSLAYLKSLVFPRKAYLRVFAVLVTQRSYASKEERVSKEDAKAWVRQGVNRLPKTIAEKAFAGYAVDVLVYEFEVPDTDFKPSQHCPCHLDARAHLQKTGLAYWLY